MTRSPSIKTLMDRLGLSRDNAEMLKNVMKAIGKVDDVDDVLRVANQILDGHGVEAIHGEWQSHYWQDIAFLYVNLGDTYETTLLYDVERDRFEVSSWGDWVEYLEARGVEIR